MTNVNTVCHGDFGKLCLFELSRAIVLHTHREAQVLFLLDGDDVTLSINDSPVTLSADRAVTIDSYMPSEVHFAKSSKPSTVLSLFINTLWYATRFKSCDLDWLSFKERSFSVSPGIKDHIDHLVSLISPPTPDKQPGYYLALETRLRHLCNACFKDGATPTSSVSPLNPLRQSDSRIRKSLMIMGEHMKNNLPLNEIARAAGLSRPHFYRLFRENLGVTPNVYMNMLRTEYAVERLVFSNQPITAIALELGFASQASFTRFFGANHGFPPTDYRRVARVSPEMRAKALANAQTEIRSFENSRPVPPLYGCQSNRSLR